MDCFCGEYRAHTVSYMYLCCGLASVGRGSRATFSLAPHWNHCSGLLSRWGLDYGTRGSRLLSCLLWVWGHGQSDLMDRTDSQTASQTDTDMYKRIGNKPRFLFFLLLFFPLGGRDGWPPIKRNYLRLRPFGPCYVGSVSVRCAASSSARSCTYIRGAVRQSSVGR